MNRQRYYDIFSPFYDRVIELHSRDGSAELRKFLIQRSGLSPGQRLLDVCTGTGAVPLAATEMYGTDVTVTGLDFSMGMLQKAYSKLQGLKAARISFVQADAAALPFGDCCFNAVTCSHAMYELQPDIRERVLGEAARVLVPGGCFAMMEHCEPERPFIRFLYRLRLAGMGRGRNLEFARDEVPFLSVYFRDIRKKLAPGGRSKVISGVRE